MLARLCHRNHRCNTLVHPADVDAVALAHADAEQPAVVAAVEDVEMGVACVARGRGDDRRREGEKDGRQPDHVGWLRGRQIRHPCWAQASKKYTYTYT